MTSAKQFLFIKLYLELEKLSKQNGEKRGNSYNKFVEKVNAWAGYSKSGKQVFCFLLRIWPKSYLLALRRSIWKKWKESQGKTLIDLK